MEKGRARKEEMSLDEELGKGTGDGRQSYLKQCCVHKHDEDDSVNDSPATLFEEASQVSLLMHHQGWDSPFSYQVFDVPDSKT